MAEQADSSIVAGGLPPARTQEVQQPAAGVAALSPRSQERKLANELEAECIETQASLQKNIYNREGDYLEKTPHGNVIKGWEGFLDTRTGSIQKRRFDDRDRLFSYSDFHFTENNPQLFTNTRDDDPDNWCIALRKRTQAKQSQHFPANLAPPSASTNGERGGSHHRKKRKNV